MGANDKVQTRHNNALIAQSFELKSKEEQIQILMSEDIIRMYDYVKELHACIQRNQDVIIDKVNENSRFIWFLRDWRKRFNDRLSALKIRVDQIDIEEIKDNLKWLWDNTAGKRKKTRKVEKIHDRIVNECFDGKCPSCMKKRKALIFHHQFSKDRYSHLETWKICLKCHTERVHAVNSSDHDYLMEEFRHYQKIKNQHLDPHPQGKLFK